jgi:hypothetical protein
MCLFVQLFGRFSIGGFPSGKSVRAPAMYDSCRCGWTGELSILGEEQETILLDQRAIGKELLALGHDVRITLGRWSLLQNCPRALEYDEAIRGALASRLRFLMRQKSTPPG